PPSISGEPRCGIRSILAVGRLAVGMGLRRNSLAPGRRALATRADPLARPLAGETGAAPQAAPQRRLLPDLTGSDPGLVVLVAHVRHLRPAVPASRSLAARRCNPDVRMDVRPQTAATVIIHRLHYIG